MDPGTSRLVVSLSLSAISTVFSVAYFVFSIVCYNVDTSKRNSVARTALVTWNERLAGTSYSCLFIVYEILLVYGYRLASSIPEPTALVILTWATGNFVSSFMVITACLSYRMYRIFLYIPYSIQLITIYFGAMDRILSDSYGPDMIILLFMILLSSWMVFFVPKVFIMSQSKILAEIGRQRNSENDDMVTSFNLSYEECVRDNGVIDNKSQFSIGDDSSSSSSSCEE